MCLLLTSSMVDGMGPKVGSVSAPAGAPCCAFQASQNPLRISWTWLTSLWSTRPSAAPSRAPEVAPADARGGKCK